MDKVMSLLFNMLSKFVIAFLPKAPLFSTFNCMPAVTVQSDLGAQENKIHLFLYLLESHPVPKAHAFAIFFITVWMSLLNLSFLIYLKSWSCFVSLHFVLLFFSFEDLQVLLWQGIDLTYLSIFIFFFLHTGTEKWKVGLWIHARLAFQIYLVLTQWPWSNYSSTMHDSSYYSLVIIGMLWGSDKLLNSYRKLYLT